MYHMPNWKKVYAKIHRRGFTGKKGIFTPRGGLPFMFVRSSADKKGRGVLRLKTPFSSRAA
jgi:hypothetical protein